MSDTTKTEKLAYSFREAQEVTSLSRRSLEYMVTCGKLNKVRVGRRVLIPANSLRELVGAKTK